MKKIRIFILICFVFSIISIKFPTHAESSSVIINEVMPNPLGSDTDFEWLELYNPTEAQIDMTNWIIDGKTISSGIIEPNGYLIVAKNKQKLLERYPTLVNVIQAGISMNNTNDVVKLENGSYSDSITYATSLENISWERINYCSIDIEMNSINADSIENVNSTFQNNYCNPEPQAPSLSFEISHDQANFDTNFESFKNSETTLKLSGETQEIKNISWYLNGILISEDFLLNFTFENIGTQNIKAIVTLNSNDVFEYTQNIEVYPNIKLNEIMPNPEGTDTGNEWIEIFSDSDVPFVINNWTLADKSNSMGLTGTFENFSVIAPDFSLINTNDVLKIQTPGGLISDEFSYVNAPDSQSYSRTIDGGGSWTDTYEITKGTPNHAIETPPITFYNILDIKNSIIGDYYSTNGIVSVDINLLGENIFYIQDDTSGIKIKLNNSLINVESIKLGSRVEIVNAELRESYDELYLNVDEASSVNIISNDNQVLVKENIDDLKNFEGQLILLEGTISKTSGSTFYISGNDIEYKISILKNTGISIEKKKNDLVKVIGIVSKYGLNEEGLINYRILPRYVSDINITTTPAITKTTKSTLSKAKVKSISTSVDTNIWAQPENLINPIKSELNPPVHVTNEPSKKDEKILLSGMSFTSLFIYSILANRSKFHLIKFL